MSRLYSVAYTIPRKIKIKLFERINNDNEGNIEEATDVREITHLMNFPFEIGTSLKRWTNNSIPPVVPNS